MARVHWLKVEHEYMDDLKNGSKPFEVRRDDRGFQKGDTLILCRYGKCRVSQIGSYGYMNRDGRVVSSYPDGDKVDRTEQLVTYVLTGGQFGIQPGHVVMGITPATPSP
jgi:hypothetical protein